MFNEIIAFSLPRIGETDNSIQDRVESSPDGSLVAIADGAGSSLYPRQWAEILVQSFCQTVADPIASLKDSYEEWLQPLQEQWRQYYLEKMRDPNRQWWQVGSQLKDHGAATFLGLKIEATAKEGQQTWQAAAVGDSCLFKLEKKNHQLSVFPSKNSRDFKSITQCFKSLPHYASCPPQFTEGNCQKGDCFLLTTDALAAWLLADYESQGEDWKQLFKLKKQADFMSFVAQLRENKQIKNDDTTAALIRILDRKPSSGRPQSSEP
jgi:serine/threonine protein phosphatase PrpC